MKKLLLSFAISFFCFFNSVQATPEYQKPVKDVPTYFIPAPNMEQIRIEDKINDKQGKLYRMGIATYINVTTENQGVWTTLPTGERMWQLVVKNPDAEALSFIFNTFKLSNESIFYVQTLEGKQVSETVTKADELESLQQHIALCFGDELVLTLIDQADEPTSEVTLDRVIYNYRSTGNPNAQKINESESCEVNINCPEGNDHYDERKGVCRIYVVNADGAGYCSGSLVNNLANNCKPYVLTALHCGPSVNTTAANMQLWKSYFLYEAPTCTNPTSAGTLATHFVTGAVRIADSNDNDGQNISKSDFLLIQIGTLSNETTTIGKLYSYNAYWNGWDANNTASTGGVSIHHPAGDIKKISTYTSTLTSTTYGGTPNTHWRVIWASTVTDHGVTEGGSSGSPIFNDNDGNSRIVGTLSGGSSYCNAPTSPDLYGKLSYHWTSNGSANNQRLKPWLDPNNTGVLVQDGASNPCNYVGINEEKKINSSVKLYPNPTTDKLSIDLTSLEGKVTIEIYDMAGKLIATSIQTAGSIIDLDMASMNKGLYNVHIKSIDLNFVQRISKM